jgi:conjugative transfer signal peptidase TraF
VDWLIRILSLWVNLSPSVPLGLYRTVHAPVERGAIVVVCLPETLGRFSRNRGYLGYGACPGHVERLGKRVGAVPGDTVDIDNDGVRINGFLIPGSRPLELDSRGRRLPHIYNRVIVKPGQLFLLATDDRRSFDSRYFGAIMPIDLLRVQRVGALEPSAEPAHDEHDLEGRDR